MPQIIFSLGLILILNPSNFKHEQVTVIIEVPTESEKKCVSWLMEELEKEVVKKGKIFVKTIEQCRGLEFPVLVTISYFEWRTDSENKSVMDPWTRVNSTLYIIHMARVFSGDFDDFGDALTAALNNQLAQKAKEQDNLPKTFWDEHFYKIFKILPMLSFFCTLMLFPLEKLWARRSDPKISVFITCILWILMYNGLISMGALLNVWFLCLLCYHSKKFKIHPKTLFIVLCISAIVIYSLYSAVSLVVLVEIVD